MRPLTRTAAALAAGVLVAGLAGCGAGSTGGATGSGPAATSGPGSATGPSAPAAASSAPTAAGNGVADAPDGTVLKKAAAAFARTSSVHISGDVASGGTKIHLDLTAGQGRTGRGTVTLDGATFDVVATGKDVYLGGDDAFWKKAAGKGAASLFRGKYLKTTRSSPDFAGIAGFFDLADLSKNLLPLDGLEGTKRETLHGVPVRVLGDSGDTRYAVATVGKPYPVEFSGTEGTDRIALTFDRYDAPLDLTPPPAAKVIDTGALRKK